MIISHVMLVYTGFMDTVDYILFVQIMRNLVKRLESFQFWRKLSVIFIVVYWPYKLHVLFAQC